MCLYGGVIKRTGTGELPVIGLFAGVTPLPQPATFITVTSRLPFEFTSINEDLQKPNDGDIRLIADDGEWRGDIINRQRYDGVAGGDYASRYSNRIGTSRRDLVWVGRSVKGILPTQRDVVEFVSKHETPSAVSPVGPPGFSVRSITLGGIALALAIPHWYLVPVSQPATAGS